MVDVSVLGNDPKKETKYNIVGFPKCGQVSLQSYMTDKYPKYNTRRDEIIWQRKGEFEFEYMHEAGIIPILITRDPLEATWSAYWYFHHGNEKSSAFMEFETFLKTPKYSEPLGERNPISCYNFAKWIKRFEKFNPVIFTMEGMMKDSKYPKLNTTVATTEYVKKMPEIPTKYKELFWKLMYREIEDHPDPCWSIDYM